MRDVDHCGLRSRKTSRSSSSSAPRRNGGVFSESELNELAMGLEVGNDQELEQFLGSLIRGQAPPSARWCPAHGAGTGRDSEPGQGELTSSPGAAQSATWCSRPGRRCRRQAGPSCVGQAFGLELEAEPGGPRVPRSPAVRAPGRQCLSRGALRGEGGLATAGGGRRHAAGHQRYAPGSRAPPRLRARAATSGAGCARATRSSSTESARHGRQLLRLLDVVAGARALLTRLERIKSFAMSETMVPAATLSMEAQAAVEPLPGQGRRELRTQLHPVHRLGGRPEGAGTTRGSPAALHVPATALQRRAVALRHLQRGPQPARREAEKLWRVWLAGLDVLLSHAGAARLRDVPPSSATWPEAPAPPSGAHAPGCPASANPPPSSRIPRERMIGNNLASSLFHEVGHRRGPARPGRVDAHRIARDAVTLGEAFAFGLWERWISEVIADVWSVARVGVTCHGQD